MPDYDWREYAESSLLERFPNWAQGAEAWRAYVEAVLETPSPARFDEFRDSLSSILPALGCPRVFVSHRQADVTLALRIAKLANEEGLEFWLDVFDPSLQALQAAASSLKPSQVALLTAGIVEMALVNSTHILVAMTPATRGSLWVPFEYGRVKDVPLASQRTAVWAHPQLAPQDFPEYCFLGVIARSEGQIRATIYLTHPFTPGRVPPWTPPNGFPRP
jgi:hypothetical protein